MSILVTGCAGFIGSHVCEHLLKSNMNVIGVDNINDYYDQNRKYNNLEILNKYNNFTFVQNDIVDSKCIDIYKPHKVIHLAGMAGVRYSLENPTLYCRVNIEGTVNLLEQSRKNNVKLFLYASSSSVYGNSKSEFREDNVLDIPESIYALTKQTVESMATMYNKLYNLNVIGFRFFTVYGPRCRPDMAPFTFIDKISKGETINKYGDGSSYRDYTHIDDIVQGIMKALDSDYDCQVFNLGNNKTWTLNEFIEMCEIVTGRKALINNLPNQMGDVNGTFANIDKSRKLLNYSPSIDPMDGLKTIN